MKATRRLDILAVVGGIIALVAVIGQICYRPIGGG